MKDLVKPTHIVPFEYEGDKYEIKLFIVDGQYKLTVDRNGELTKLTMTCDIDNVPYGILINNLKGAIKEIVDSQKNKTA